MLFSNAVLASLLAGSVIATPTARQNKEIKKPVVAHYMVGEIFDEHTRQDIKDAQSIGIDAFAMNFDQFARWSNSTVKYLFKNAEKAGFHLFFSFDHNYFNDPMQYAAYVNEWTGSPAYLKINNKALVSTFGGESIKNAKWAEFKAATKNTIVVPGYRSAPDANLFTSLPALDGVFNWNSWPQTAEGKVTVSGAGDKTFNDAAHASDKLFMMGISPVQFKHLSYRDKKPDNWYRRGESNLEYRLGQALSLQPDILQLQTWNDAGEGHYMGNLWPEPMTVSTDIQNLVHNRGHTGYWQILRPFIKAWKNGDTTTANMVPDNGKDIQGTFWHHTLTVDATCGTAALPKSPDIKKAAEDVVSGIILVAKGKTGLVGVVNVGTKQLGTINLKPGFNRFQFGKLEPGKVQVEVWRDSTMIGGGYGSLLVKDNGKVCNYGFQVVGFPG